MLRQQVKVNQERKVRDTLNKVESPQDQHTFCNPQIQILSMEGVT